MLIIVTIFVVKLFPTRSIYFRFLKEIFQRFLLTTTKKIELNFNDLLNGKRGHGKRC